MLLNEKEFDLTGDNFVDDDKELTDKYADTNENHMRTMHLITKSESILNQLNQVKNLFTKYGWIQLNLMQTTKTISNQ